MIRPELDAYDDAYSGDGRYSSRPEVLVRGPTSWIGELDWIGLRHEVETEARAEIILLGLGNAGKSTLFNSLRGWPVTLTALKLGEQTSSVEEPMGLFTLIDLPQDGDLHEDLLLERLERASLLVYLLDGAVGSAQREPSGAVVRPADCRWIGRLQATGRPLVVALNKADLWKGRRRALLESVERRLGVQVVPVSAYDSPETQQAFLARMIEACPLLAVPLGREVAAFRRAAAERIIRRAALLCGLVAMEPIPLVDLPMQVGAQVGLVARIATMYGHPPSSDYARELVLTGAGSAGLRLLTMQAAKFVPVLGWALSGALGAASTWLLGQAAVAYFEGAVPATVKTSDSIPRWPDQMFSRWRQKLSALRLGCWWGARLRWAARLRRAVELSCAESEFDTPGGSHRRGRGGEA
jgi:uncharacterized protein (DUF697 family)/GTP-binding protein EngB required for normal cell division